MQTILYSPCSSRWVLTDIIYIYMLEPTSATSSPASQLIQNTAANVAGRSLLGRALKRVVAGNVLFLLGAMAIGRGLQYAIQKYQERKKAAELAENENKPLKPTIIVPAPSKPLEEQPKPIIFYN